ncbi:hypothetical protein EV697_102184 [Bisgaardia hudsonensis]|uniref:Uncharacterized protein n=1 Tax=Bisgaardia hudsonensis TaxID=109472 RepID=A0A4R2N1B0_9PAST|nr:hypothetical protein A6A11_05600 [Bisgaardia hudsonensis]TCP13306.1 hypothetical protein EV697_102184 [Bisgaardia hudsonensis]
MTQNGGKNEQIKVKFNLQINSVKSKIREVKESVDNKAELVKADARAKKEILEKRIDEKKAKIKDLEKSLADKKTSIKNAVEEFK